MVEKFKDKICLRGLRPVDRISSRSMNWHLAYTHDESRVYLCDCMKNMRVGGKVKWLTTSKGKYRHKLERSKYNIKFRG